MGGFGIGIKSIYTWINTFTCGFIYHVNESLIISQKCTKLTSSKRQDSQRIGSSSKPANVEIVEGLNVISSGAMGLP